MFMIFTCWLSQQCSQRGNKGSPLLGYFKSCLLDAGMLAAWGVANTWQHFSCTDTAFAGSGQAQQCRIFCLILCFLTIDRNIHAALEAKAVEEAHEYYGEGR